jgi:hypothetical protein
LFPSDEAFFESVLPAYVQAVYPLFPIITGREAHQSIAQLHIRTEASFVCALAAITVGHTRIHTTKERDLTALVKSLSEQSLEFRGPVKSSADINLKMIMTSCILSCTFWIINDFAAAWLYLREAITMLTILDMYENEKLSALPLVERSRWQRLYWLLFIHERFLAIHHYRPVEMKPLSKLPERDTTLPVGIQDGFSQLIKLFSLVDTEFVSAHLDNSLQITEKWIEDKHSQVMAATELRNLSKMQKVDLIVTQQWLRVLLWRMLMKRFMFTSEEALSSRLYVDVAHKLRILMTFCSQKSIEAYVCGILHKLFEVVMRMSEFQSLIRLKHAEESVNRGQQSLSIGFGLHLLGYIGIYSNGI